MTNVGLERVKSWISSLPSWKTLDQGGKFRGGNPAGQTGKGSFNTIEEFTRAEQEGQKEGWEKRLSILRSDVLGRNLAGTYEFQA